MLLNIPQTEKRNGLKNQIPTYPSVVLYAVVDRNPSRRALPPIEMLVGNPDELDESEVTAYILSIDDRTLCADDELRSCHRPDL